MVEPPPLAAPSLLYLPLERVHTARPVDRVSYLKMVVRGKTVLDIGALDETAYKLKQNDGSWLHLALAETARKVVGIDSSASVPPEGIDTSKTSRIIKLDVERIAEIPELIAFNVIVAGEIIEHLPNALQFLLSLRKAGFEAGTELLLTTPNATALHNVLLGLLSRESSHRDHIAIYSYKTLNTLCVRAGFSSWRLVPYTVRFTEMLNSTRGMTRIGIAIAERLVNAVSWLFPMLSAGWIVQAQL